MQSRFPATILAATAIAAWTLILSSHGWGVPSVLFAPLSILICLGVIALGLFDGWAWAWWGVRLFAKRPDLRGTWGGVIRSSWARSVDGARPAPIRAYLVVHQTYTTIHMRLLTSESQSITLAAALTHEPDGAFTLSGIYRNEPRLSVRGRSPMHHGGIVLRLGGPPPILMSGQYWTDRQTDGELEFRLLTRECISDFYTAQSAYSPEITDPGAPMSQDMAPRTRDADAHVEGRNKGRDENHLSDDAILELYTAAVKCELDRDALLAGLEPSLVAQLRSHAAPGPQMMADLHALNKIRQLGDGSAPFKSWLSTAAHLTSPRAESKVFQKYLALMEAIPGTSGHHAANE